MDRIDNGFSTTMSFAANPTIEFYEIEVQPPGWEGGEPIPTSTMRNLTLHTFSPGALITMTPIAISAAYTAGAFHLTTGIKPMINVNQLVKVTLPNGATIDFWAFLKNFIPPSHAINTRPMAAMTVQPTNTNTVKVETLPIYTPAA